MYHKFLIVYLMPHSTSGHATPPLTKPLHISHNTHDIDICRLTAYGDAGLAGLGNAAVYLGQW